MSANESFIERTRLARKRRFPSQQFIADSLGIDGATYAKYETRTPLPHRYVEEFCRLTGVSIYWLFSGKKSEVDAILEQDSEVLSLHAKYLALDNDGRRIVDALLLGDK